MKDQCHHLPFLSIKSLPPTLIKVQLLTLYSRRSRAQAPSSLHYSMSGYLEANQLETHGRAASDGWTWSFYFSVTDASFLKVGNFLFHAAADECAVLPGVITSVPGKQGGQVERRRMPGMAAVLPLSALFSQVSIRSSPGRRDNSHQHSKSQEEAEQSERRMGQESPSVSSYLSGFPSCCCDRMQFRK